MKWWLISEETVKIIRDALDSPTHAGNESNCQEYMDWPPGTVCSGCKGDEKRDMAVHELDSGLHITEEVPWDMKEESQ